MTSQIFPQFNSPFTFFDEFKNIKRLLLLNLIVFLLIQIFMKAGYLLASGETSIVAFWPVSGIASALLLVYGLACLPALLISYSLASFLEGNTLLITVAFTVAAFLEWAIFALLVCRIREIWKQKHSFFLPVLFLSIAAISSFVAALVGPLSLVFWGGMPLDSYFSSSISWWLGDFVGIILFFPLISFLQKGKMTGNMLSHLILLISLSSLLLLSIVHFDLAAHFLVLYLLIIILSCYWCSHQSLFLLNALFALALIYITSKEMGPFVNALGEVDYNFLNLFLVAIGALMLQVVFLTKDNNSITLVWPLFLLFSGVIVSGGIYNYLKTTNEEIETNLFNDLIAESELAIQNRLEIYINALRSGASLFYASDSVDRNEWRLFAGSLDLNNRYPGINGIGVIEPVKNEEIESYLYEVRSDGFSDFKIKQVPNVQAPPPDELGISHYIIRYIEPVEINEQAIGLNVASEANRQQAAKISRDTGMAQITGRINLIQDGKSRPGFLLYLPVYKKYDIENSVETRREQFVRWVYAPFITEKLFEGVMGLKESQIGFAIFDSKTIEEASFVVSSFKNEFEPGSEFDKVSQLNLAGQFFTIGWTPGIDFQRRSDLAPVLASFGFGLGILLLSGLISSLILTNKTAEWVVDQRTKELRGLNSKLEEEVADRRMAEEEALSASQAKSDFLATMSHEIRTPMNSVIGFANILKDSELNPEQKEWVNSITSSADALMIIINEILDFSKIEANKLKIEYIPANFLGLCREVAQSFGPLVDQSKNTLKLNVHGIIPEQLIFDPTRIRQIITNLLSNANKFTENGMISIDLEWIPNIGENSGRVSLTVKDTGIGVSKDKIEELFQPFTQADGTTTRRFGGTGLGLAICKKLIELMHGKLDFSSEEGEGTQVQLIIPVGFIDDENEVAKKNKVDGSKTFSIPGLLTRVLVVEDVALNRKLAKIFLENLGCQVETANNGKEGFEAVKSGHFDIIFMDMQMPEIDGLTATKLIRNWELEEQRKPIKIISMTANVGIEFKEKSRRAGMDGFLTKPFSQKDFMEMLKS